MDEKKERKKKRERELEGRRAITKEVGKLRRAEIAAEF